MEFIYIFFSVIGFAVAAFLALYIPGRVSLGENKQFSPIVLHTLSVAVGIVLFAWQGYVFGSLRIRWASYIYLVLFVLWYVYKKYYPQKFSLKRIQIDWISFLLIVMGVFAQVIPYIRMGWVTSQGIIVSAHNDPDHIWHATLVHELVNRYPPYEPGIAGVLLKDYHYWFNLVTADIIRVFNLPLFTTQFIGMYILGSILFGLLIYIIAQQLYPSKLFTRLCLFFVYFTGNAAGWYMLFSSHVFDWNVSSLIVDGTKFMDSPAYGYGIVVGLTGIFFLLQKKLSWIYVMLAALCFGSLLEFKVYIGITFFAGLGVFALFGLLEKDIKRLVLFALSVIFGLIIFLPALTPGGGLAYIPFDIPRDFINQVKLGHADWQLRWVIFQQHHNILRVIQYGLMMSGIYLLIQYGILLLGFAPLKRTRKIFGSLLFFLYATIVVGLVMGLLFYQKVGGANIWEFFLAGVPLLALLVAGNITSLLEKKNTVVQGVILTLIILFTIPQWMLSLTTYIHDEFFVPFHGISQSELASFGYIKDNTPFDSTVLVLGQQRYVAYSSILSLFVNRDLYLSGEGVRQKKTPTIIHREYILRKVSTLYNPAEISALLIPEHVAYIYLYNGVYPNLRGDGTHLIKRFANQTETIYQVNK